MRVAICGAGAFGTALALTLSQKAEVTLWTRNADQAQAMRVDSVTHGRLSGYPLLETLIVTSEPRDLATAQAVLLAVPMQKLRGFLTEHQGALAGKILVACCKGVELSSGLGPVGVIAEMSPHSTGAILTGPSFAADIANGLPTALTLACENDSTGAQLQQTLSTPTLRIYRTTDVVGAELGGALKNVIAIASGVAIGAGLGDSARAALMTRGFAEMQRLAASLGADPATLQGLSGFGDLVLTCTSEGSRNYRLGLSMGSGAEFDPDTTVEGAATAIAVEALAHKRGVDMPITSGVAALLEKRLDVANAMARLLARPLKEE